METQRTNSLPLNFRLSTSPRKIMQTYTKRSRQRDHPVKPKDVTSESLFLTQESANLDYELDAAASDDVPTAKSDAALISAPENNSSAPSGVSQRPKRPLIHDRAPDQSGSVPSIELLTLRIAGERPRLRAAALDQVEVTYSVPSVDQGTAEKRAPTQNNGANQDRRSGAPMKRVEREREFQAKRPKIGRRKAVQGLTLVSRLLLQDGRPSTSYPPIALKRSASDTPKTLSGLRKSSTSKPRTRKPRQSSIDPEDFKFPPKTPTPARHPLQTPGSDFNGTKFDLGGRRIWTSSLTRRVNHRTKGSSHFYSRAILPRALQLTTKLASTASKETSSAECEDKLTSNGGLAVTWRHNLGTKDSNHATTSITKPLITAGHLRLSPNSEIPSCGINATTADAQQHRPEASEILGGPPTPELGGWLTRKRASLIAGYGFDDDYFLQNPPAANAGCISTLLNDTVPKIPDVIVKSPASNNGKHTRDGEQIPEAGCVTLFIGVAKQNQKLSMRCGSQPRIEVRATQDPVYRTDGPEHQDFSSSSSRAVPESSIEPRTYFTSAVELLSSSQQAPPTVVAAITRTPRLRKPSMKAEANAQTDHEFGTKAGAQRLRDELKAVGSQGVSN